MKCDVCLTNIPLGEDTCPNCGYKMRVDHVSSYDASGKTHNHIQMKSNYVKSRVKNSFDKPSNQRAKFISKIILIVVSIAIVVSFASTLFLTISNIIDDNEITHEYNDFEDLSYEDIIDNGYDYDGTIEATVEYEDDIVTYLNDMNYKNIEVSESVDNDGIKLRTSLYIEFESHYHYAITIQHQQAELSKVELTVSGRFETDRSQFILTEDDISDIANYIGIDSAYSLLNDSHSKMTKSDDEYKYSYYEDEVNVYMSEKYYNMKEPYYWFYYSLSMEP